MGEKMKNRTLSAAWICSTGGLDCLGITNRTKNRMYQINEKGYRFLSCTGARFIKSTCIHAMTINASNR